MLLALFLRSLGCRPARQRATLARRPRRSFVPRLTALEDRALPSTFTVTTLADGGTGSLRWAVGQANAHPGADIVFAHGLKGTITLASELAVTADQTIDGPGANRLTVSGGGATRVFHASGATHLAIDGLTIANGLASVPAGPAFGGGLLNDGASVSLSRVAFVHNEAQSTGGFAGGGTVANLGGARLSADQTDFLGNTVSGANTSFGNGGAVYDDQHAVVDIACGTFAGNLATAGNANGGAIGHYGGSQLTVAHCSFTGNQTLALPPGVAGLGSPQDAAGGAVESDESITGFFGDLGQPTMTVTHCSFVGNQVLVAAATDGNDGGNCQGGALDFENHAKATISDSTFDSNSARGGDGGDGGPGLDGGPGGTAAGGAISNISSFVAVTNSLFRGNEVHGGNGGQGGSGGNGGDGGGFSPGGAIDTTFATGDVAATIGIANCTFVGNRAIGGDGGAGGAGGNGGSGMRGDGGAIVNFLGTMTINDCIIVLNTARGGVGGAPGSGGVGGDGGLGRGGGLSNERGGTAIVTGTAIVNNQALGGAGAAGGNGGNAVGGGVYNGRFTNQVAALELIDCAVSDNLARGGRGGVGGNGGYALGGGIGNANTDAAGGLITSDPYPILDLDGTNVAGNRAVGGAAGAGGVAGAGVGGGLYNQIGAVAEVNARSHIRGNRASTSDDDVFGTLTPI